MAPERLHIAGFKQFSFKTLKALSKTTEHHDLYRDSPSLKEICRDFADFLPRFSYSLMTFIMFTVFF